jgi:hypothetical protein
MLGLSKCYSDITSSQLSREQILQYWPPTWSLRRSRRKRNLQAQEKEVRLTIDPAAGALAAAHATGGRPDSFDGWFEDNLANHAATAAPSKLRKK